MLKIFYDPLVHVRAEYNERCESWDMINQHYHNTYEIYMLTEGERKISVGGQNHLMKPYELLIIQPYILHYFMTETSHITKCALNIPPEIFSGFLEQSEIEFLTSNISSCVIPLKDDIKETVTEYFKQIKLHNYQQNPLSYKITICYILQFFDCLKDLIPQASKIFDLRERKLNPEMILAIQFIHENYRDCELGMDDVLNHIHMSRSRFCEVFHQTTGQTFLKYLNALRIESAKADLRRSDKPLTLLADNNGFASAAHMARNFNAAVGMPPSEYRKRYKEN